MVTFTVAVLDQFEFEIASYTQDFYAAYIGDTILYFSDPLTGGINAIVTRVHMVGYANYNLALGKPATCSGTENETVNGADKAVDGDLDTRWSSRFRDDEWIEVDLQAEYWLDSVVLYWEAAYATSYTIYLISETGEEHTIVITEAEGGTVTHLVPEGVSAQKVRILCQTRNTGYGSSLFEIEVYGSGRVHPLEPPVEPTAVEAVSGERLEVSGAKKLLRNEVLLILRDGKIYNAQGARLR